jgi:hypothetical protein
MGTTVNNRPVHVRPSGAARRPSAAAPSLPGLHRGLTTAVPGPEVATGSSPITLTAMRSMVLAADSLQQFLAERDTATERAAIALDQTDPQLTDLVRKYQVASRQFIKDWLRNIRQSAWLVSAQSGRTLDTLPARPQHRKGLTAATQVMLAEDQQLHGLRHRFVRAGLGIPLTIWNPQSRADDDAVPLGSTAARPLTAIVSVHQPADEPSRAVRVELVDPVRATTVSIAGTLVPLAADFTAPIAHTLGAGRKPAAAAYGLRDAARRGTIDGFIALTPFAPGRVPLVLVDGAGFSPLMMAQIANEIAGSNDLRQRFQVWRYQYATAAPLFYSASVFRDDIERLSARIEQAIGRSFTGRAVVIAHGAGAVLAKTLLVDSATRLWNAAFSSPLSQLALASADRGLLERVFFWERSRRIDRVIVVDEPGNAAALSRGAGARAVRLLLSQPAAFRDAIGRIQGGLKRHVRPALADDGAADAAEPFGVSGFPEQVFQPLSDVAVASDRALISFVAAADGTATGTDRAHAVAVYSAARGLAPVMSEIPRAGLGAFGPGAVRLILDALRLKHRGIEQRTGGAPALAPQACVNA